MYYYSNIEEIMMSNEALLGLGFIIASSNAIMMQW
ncbi:MAG: hypothetical protein ACI8TE_001085 [Francisella sp.]|jgi:hypothetical protein